jgi:hypothetical protein
MKWRPIVIAGLICAAVAGIVHPDFQGKKPTHELIERLHREHLERQEAIHSKLNEVHQHLIAKQVTGNDRHAPGAPGLSREWGPPGRISGGRGPPGWVGLAVG